MIRIGGFILTRPLRIFCAFIALFFLAGCAAQQSRPVILEDAERLNNEGVAAYQEANWYRAKQLFSKSLLLYQGIDNQEGILLTIINLIEVALSVSDFHTAEIYLSKASDMVQLPDLERYQNRVILLFSQYAIKKQQFDKAEQLLQNLLPEFKGVKPTSVPDSIQISAIANQTRMALLQHQDGELWIQRYASALKVAGIDSGSLKGLLFRYQATLLLREKKYQEAAKKLQLALDIYKANLVQPGIAATLSELGELYLQQGNWVKAKHFFTRANVVLRYIGNRDKIIENTEKLARIESQLGNVERSSMIQKWLLERKMRPVDKNRNYLPLIEGSDYLKPD